MAQPHQPRCPFRQGPRERVFTLVELPIVVALIGVLAVVAIPNYVKSRGTAQANTYISNLQQIDGAIQSWALDMKRTTGQSVSYDDISSYLKHTVACPAGGTSFGDSYTISTVNTPPTCQRQPATHKLPL